MTNKINVFIASPGGLEEERKLFRETLAQLSREYQRSRLCEYEFIAFGWEDTSPSANRPQSVINEHLDKCHFYVQILHTRWGSSPYSREQCDSGNTDPVITSGTEEEYERAKTLINDPSKPMQDMALYFKDVHPDLMADPGEQFKKVKEFREKVEMDKFPYFDTYDEPALFVKKLRLLVSDWISILNTGERLEKTNSPVFNTTPDAFTVSINDELHQIVNNAWNEANTGHLLKAEILFSKAIVRRQKEIFPIRQYARYLALIGHFAHAEALLKDALLLEEGTKNVDIQASIYSDLGNLYSMRSENMQAKSMYEKGMSLLDGTENKLGYLSLFISLIHVYEVIKPVEVEPMLLTALKGCSEAGYSDGLFQVYTYLGNINTRRDYKDKAEEMYDMALELAMQANSKHEQATAHINLGRLYHLQGIKEKAKTAFEDALSISEPLGIKEDIAIIKQNLGGVYSQDGDFEKAKKLHEEALALAKEYGYKSVQAAAHIDLGSLNPPVSG